MRCHHPQTRYSGPNPIKPPQTALGRVAAAVNPMVAMRGASRRGGPFAAKSGVSTRRAGRGGGRAGRGEPKTGL